MKQKVKLMSMKPVDKSKRQGFYKPALAVTPLKIPTT